ncbi:MAG: hypothetical protein GY950_18660, partial [bacterium]|nr:hypothetical protein [bacterium]
MIKEFLFVAPHGEIHTVHIGIFPAYGRYFRKKMVNSSDGLFRTEIEMEKGEMYYHYFLNNDFSRPFHNNAEDLISKNDPMLRSSVNSETEPFCALQFDNVEPFIFPVTPDKWVVRAVSHHSWIES